jgi:hypothetical protein
MGSLDDTSVAQFKLIRGSRTSAPAGKPAVPAPANHARTLPTAPAAIKSAPVIGTPLRATLVAPQSRLASSPSHAPRASLSPTDVLKLLESAPRASHRAAPPVSKAPPPARASATEPQKFAVQLVWSTDMVDAARVPQLAIFDAYTLYTVQVERAGRRWHGLRLGFFSDPVSARQVALYARSDFSAAAVVPVSDRECAKANEVAAAHGARTGQSVQAPKRDTDTIELKEDDTPRTRSAPLQESLLAPLETTRPETPSPAKPTVQPRQAGSVKNKPIAVKPPSPAPQAPKKRVAKTTAQLIEELGADTLDLDFTNPGRDDLNDSGVRHLSVSVVQRKSPLGRLLAKVGRRRHA